MNQQNVTITHNPDQQRFETTIDGHTAELTYQQHGTTIVYDHTGVPPALEGQGIGSALASTALEYARDQQLRVVPVCSFVAAYIRRHPEYRDLVD